MPTSKLTPTQQVTWDGLLAMGLNPEDYYDFDNNEIIDFPPPTTELLEKLKPIKQRMAESNKRIDELLGESNDH